MYEELLSNEENTIPTHHPKIMIGKVNTKDHNSIKTLVTELISQVANQKNEEIVKQMKEIVPEFVSNNSEFSKFDN
jgi:FlaA1/EpsC-like NDP-sugar epimerase